MQSDNGPPHSPDNDQAPAQTGPAVAGLPPVKPPSGKFILQLFLVPGLIVAVVVGLLLVGRWLLGGSHTPEEFLKGLDNSNPEVRWRTAADLASVLPMNEELSNNPGFALALAERLADAIERSKEAEAARFERHKAGKQTDAERQRDRKTLENDRKFVLFLASCLGYFRAPVGAPLLAEMALPQPGLEPDALRNRREHALFALILLGGNVKKFDQLSPREQTVLLAALGQEAKRKGRRAQWAAQAHAFLEARREGRPAALADVASTLIHCAGDDDPYFRKLAAVALTYWDAPAAESDPVEAALLLLAGDEGRGATDGREEREGRDVRYNAVQSLARRGSSRTADHFDVMKEMLDLEAQTRYQPPPAEGNAVVVVLGALRAVRDLHRENPSFDLAELRPSVEALARSGNDSVNTEAKELLKHLK